MARRTSTRRLRSTIDSVLLHDMKNLGGRLNLLLSNLDEHYGDPEFKRSVVELLSSTVEKLDAIASRFTAHQDAVLIKVSLDLNDLLREVVKSVRTKTGGPRSRVELDLAAVPAVWGDPYYLADAFGSIVQNALEAAGSGGHVRITTRAGSSRKRPTAIVEVEDSGPGMPAEFLRERLFRPFQTTKANGVGLGLYTARHMIGFHGGAIRVLSKVGEGTRVTVTIPREAGGDAAPG